MTKPPVDTTAPDDVYRRLQQRIDQLPVPFPSTSSGVELRLLKALFSEHEAQVALSLSALTESAEIIQRRIGDMDLDDLAPMLSGLAGKGAINAGVTRVGNKRVHTYGLAPLVVGMFEFQVDKLTPGFIADFQEYLDQGFRSSFIGGRSGQMRTVPIRAEVASERKVAPYNDIRSYVANHPGPFSVINCVCRQSAEVSGEACTTSSSHETCLMLGHVPPHAKRLSRDEFIAILDRSEREGHVLQPQNSQKPAFICCCCRDCCEILRNARKLPRPADAIPNAYRAQVDATRCTGCRVCVKRCPMDAIVVTDKLAQVNEGRCIGCGLCATTCPETAITLTRRTGKPRTPRNTLWMYLRLYRDRRGIFGLVGIAIRRLFGWKI
jgi:H+/Na+-translocating ferredoxin:NAD+ oxidoreductase subunit B